MDVRGKSVSQLRAITVSADKALKIARGENDRLKGRLVRRDRDLKTLKELADARLKTIKRLERGIAYDRD